MRESALLEHIFKTAERLMRVDKKEKISAEYYMVSLFRVFTMKERGRFPKSLNNEAVEEELQFTMDLFSGLHKDYDDAAAEILKMVREGEDNPDSDDFVFKKYIFSSYEQANNEGEEFVTSDLFTKVVLADPTNIIKKVVLDSDYREEPKTEKDREKGVQEEEILDLLRQLMGEKKTDTSGKEEKKPQKKEPEAPKEAKNDGKERMSLSVDNARKIQETLLSKVFGQDQAVNTFVSGFFQSQMTAQIRKNNNKPQVTFLFAGPPGVGKTFLAEMAAEALSLPYQRFDMSEYSDKEANLEFCGIDQSYKNAKEGNVTGFVNKNPKCVLLFDEIEKAHINIIHLFLQILDAGRIRDNYTNEEVSFTEAIIIFTTNVGRLLYDDPSVSNLSSLPKKRVLKAISSEINPNTNAPMFPAAICSRFASGNVVMFNHLNANNLLTIASKELDNNIKGLEAATGIKIDIDPKIPAAIMFSEGGKADARMVKSRANSFFHDELFELLRLVASTDNGETIKSLKHMNIKISLDGCDAAISKLFVSEQLPEILIFADESTAKKCRKNIHSAIVFSTDKIEEAQDILFNQNISVILCDIRCGSLPNTEALLNAEDIKSDGIAFLNMAVEKYGLPIFVLQNYKKDLSQEELVSFFRIGVQGTVVIHPDNSQKSFDAQVGDKCAAAFLQASMLELAKTNKVLTYQTSQTVTENKEDATITLFDFKMHLSTDTEDTHSVLDNASKPNVRFDDVIGAEDAKEELEYFVRFLKDPKAFVRKGMKMPKGVLLYGPPGTGKTLLAKAMAGESDVTFLKAEGNQFFKKYVGEGSESVHALFSTARKYAPAILFVDEIDAIGMNRSYDGGNDANGSILTSFLTEMDGFNVDPSRPVFVLAATNFDVTPNANSRKSLDPALLRRFDRRIFVDLPKKDERKKFVRKRMEKTHGISLSEDQIENIAIRSTGMSLADLDSVFELAMRSAFRSNQSQVNDEALEEAFEVFNGGEEKKWGSDSLLRTARHEAGHALLCWLSGEKPSYLTIVARGDHGGYMQHADSEAKGLYTKKELLNRIQTALGGRAAEIVYYGEEDGISTGAGGDLQSATQTALYMICNCGMDANVGLAYIDYNNTQFAKDITVRVNDILREEMRVAIQTISCHKEAIDKLVDALMAKNHLKENEIDEILSQLN